MSAVTLLGVKGGPSVYPGAPMPTAHLLQMAGQTIVVDCGLGVSRALAEAGIELTQIDLIVITHLHSDHYVELGPLLHTAWTAGLSQPMPVIGPSGLARYLALFCDAMAEDIDLRVEDEGRTPLAEQIAFTPLTEGQIDLQGGITMEAMRNVHPPIKETFALRFEGEGKRVVFSGDTAPMAEMEDFARNADLLIHEAMLTAGVDAICARDSNSDERLRVHLLQSHSPAADVARIATAAGARQLALNHLVPAADPSFTEAHWRAEVEPHYPGPLYIGRDGMRIAL